MFTLRVCHVTNILDIDIGINEQLQDQLLRQNHHWHNLVLS